MAVTIKEVAKEAGVSVQTVSRVINNRPDVALATRRSVQAVIDRLGYQPNAIARSLSRQRTHTIGVVATDLHHYGPMRTLSGIEQEANVLGYSLILSLIHNHERDNGEQALSNLLSRQVDGVIWAAAEVGQNRTWLEDKLDNIAVPIVFIGTPPYQKPLAIPSERITGQLAVEHLLSQGYRHIGLITGPLAWLPARQRQLGWQDVVLQFSPKQVHEGDWTAMSGAKGLHCLLETYPQLDAVYTSNDQMALGVLQTAHQLGLRVPEDLGVVGTDNIPESAMFWPPLTTLQLYMIKKSKMAVQELHRLIEAKTRNKFLRQSEPIYAEPELIVRQSSTRLNPITSVSTPSSGS